MLLQILRKEKLFEGKFTKLWGTIFLDKKGNECVWEWLDKKNIALVLAVTKDKKIVLIKNYRVPIEKYCIEFPAGLLDKVDESPEEAARRELLEETGYTGENFIALTSYGNSVAAMNNIAYPFVLVDAEKVSESSLEDSEDIEVIEVPCDQLYEFYEKSIAEGLDFNIRILALYEIAKRKGLI